MWYKFLTENHALGTKAAFVGMNKGGVNTFNCGVRSNPDTATQPSIVRYADVCTPYPTGREIHGAGKTVHFTGTPF